jgi:hypothetical protein
MGCIRYICFEVSEHNLILGRIPILRVNLAILFDIRCLTLNDGEVKFDAFD